MVDIYTATVTTQEILAIAYAFVFVYTLYILKSNYANDSPLIRKFYYFLLLDCVLRFAYFFLPPDVWGMENDEPQDLERFQRSWWAEWANNSLYVLGNSCIEACYIQVLKMWANAQSVVSGQSTAMWRRFLDILLGAYCIWNFTLIALYLFMPYHVLLVCSALVATVVRGIVVFGYVTSWLAIWAALEMAAKRPKCSKLLFGCSRQSVASQPLLPIDMDQHNTLKARDMLARITRVSLGFTIFASAKLVTLIYLAIRILTDSLAKDVKFWWSVIFFDFLLAEIVAGCVVLFIMRKRRRQRIDSPLSLPKSPLIT